MSKLKIYTKENSILRKKAKNIKKVNEANIRNLAADMIETMEKEKGIGLAAPQVGKSQRIICLKTKKGNLILINPVITKKSFRKNVAEEGCLSVPGIFALVKRHNAILVRAINLDNQKINFKAKGLLARVIQHEVDHLDGILFIDKIEKKKQGGKDERKI